MSSSNVPIAAFPAKRFFVEMLTRDIELADSILDLLDNCLDGVLRKNNYTAEQTFEKPDIYKGYYAHIEYNENGFKITDNCGGIPGELAEKYAFRLGRPAEREAESLPTIGVYGIGMKRAIFKMGTSAQILSKTKDEQFSVKISPEWMDDDNNWSLELERKDVGLKETGVSIEINNLRKDIKVRFSKERGFEADLITMISNHYSLIIKKGFEVKINNTIVKPNSTRLIFDENALREDIDGIVPYVYKNESNGVSIKVAVGFYRNLPSDEEEENLLSGRSTTEKAGWTIICNDRVVLHADKSKLTGWGEAGVPQYHTQFVGIAGVVIFTSSNAEALPITTTKRGVDGNSDLYLSTKDFMREGLKFFTDFTNKWKNNSDERKEIVNTASNMVSTTESDFIKSIPDEKWSTVRRSIGGQVFKPKLPLPRDTDPLRQIKFSRRHSEIKLVSEFIFDDPTQPPTEVGQFCFDEFLKKAKQ
ncbi:ATPase [Kosakonia radicincitans UMEnt01/12]|uniref:ATP-binding protein n=1 Tax=Kosakonia radicincitans TaxID=283686 RepID=UPI0004612D91|nr:ATP-binding protein [Kosakonia radicincitans]KDE34375.1 ATPase [Kosakonia radicincitans UMEnt01/12]